MKDVNIGIYPQVRIAPSEFSVARQMADGGRVYTIPLLISKKIEVAGRPVGFTFNSAYERGTAGAPSDAYIAGAIGTAITPVTSIFLSGSDQRYFDVGHHRLVKIEVGVSHKILKTASWYAMVGKIPNVDRNLDNQSHWIADIGMQFVFNVRKQKSDVKSDQK